MRRIRLTVLIGVAAAAAAGLAACESEKPNAHDDVFEAGDADMNERLDAYAEDQPAEPATEPPEPAEPPADEPPEAEPMDP